MSAEAQDFLATFHSLPPATRNEVAAEILQSTAAQEAADIEWLRSEIQKGIDSPEVSADDAARRLRRVAESLARDPS